MPKTLIEIEIGNGNRLTSNTMCKGATSIIHAIFLCNLEMVTCVFSLLYIRYVVNGDRNSIIQAFCACKGEILNIMANIFSPDDRYMYKWLKRALRECKPHFTTQDDSHPKRFITVVSALREVGYDFGAHREKIDALFQRLTEDDIYKYSLLKYTDKLLQSVSIYDIDDTIPNSPFEDIQTALCNTFRKCLNEDEKTSK